MNTRLPIEMRKPLKSQWLSQLLSHYHYKETNAEIVDCWANARQAEQTKPKGKQSKGSQKYGHS
ncbi:TPA: hypothetical protein ACGU7E_003153 [Vibrio vulnificus]|uniref:hypothetical protein n=1 Tax=Vibrio vulnificus TaxID=672 RepID=UPI0006898038|nr:hypothetical protein [Vibrio vulnificus]EIO3977837.1 hypothetical protein [Vibrio vulnificus]HDY7473854.1 hypothetical protein [Vibrio vulnificus]HDY8229551.1 hypothetical protein [Vibrio vulnificus]